MRSAAQPSQFIGPVIIGPRKAVGLGAGKREKLRRIWAGDAVDQLSAFAGDEADDAEDDRRSGTDAEDDPNAAVVGRFASDHVDHRRT